MINNMVYSVNNISSLGTILGIWAHPDDECWASAGIMKAAIHNGQHVACITATVGEQGKTADEQRWPAAQLGTIRRTELENSLAVLGAIEHYWLDCRDGMLASTTPDQYIDTIAAHIQQIRPQTILSFGSDGLTGHEDHRTIHTWAKRALVQSGSSAALYCVTESKENYVTAGKQLDKQHNIYFNIETPKIMCQDDVDICFRLTDALIETKIAALRAQASQTLQMFGESGAIPATLRTFISCECFVRDHLNEAGPLN